MLIIFMMFPLRIEREVIIFPGIFHVFLGVSGPNFVKNLESKNKDPVWKSIIFQV